MNSFRECYVRAHLAYMFEYIQFNSISDNEKAEKRMLRTIKGVTLRDKGKSVDIRKELGANSIKRKSER